MTPAVLRYFRRYSIVAILFLAGCLEAYDPPDGYMPAETLVIDGLVNATENTAVVRLSRPHPLSMKDETGWVSGATVSITSSLGEIILNESEPGTYTKTELNVIIGEKYTLHVTTGDGHEYYSDPVEVFPTPPIDNINLALTNNGTGAEIRLDARDLSGNAKYFSWDYIETYEYTANNFSGYIMVDTVPMIRRPDQQIYRCWRSIPSSTIGIVTTRDLSASVVNQIPIVTIPGGSIKLSVRYSLLVSQRVIGQDEYNYLRQLKNTTENLGGLFDPQPGTIRGNVHEKDKPGTYVLGYFTASQIRQKRFFTTYSELPEVLKIPQSGAGCNPEYTCHINDVQPIGCLKMDEIGPFSNILSAEFDATGNPVRFVYVKDDCSDCRIHGGVTTRPDFWPQPD